MKNCPCHTCRAARSVRRTKIVSAWIAAIALTVLVCFVSFAATGCTTTPEPVRSEMASFDGSEQNSGVISVDDRGAIVTAHFRDRYNGLIAIYGKAYKPALKKDAGLLKLSDSTWLIDRQHLVKMIEMNTWRKTGRTSPK